MHDWWRGATIYQIYPRSFADSDGDGIGDLRGITGHLDHVASLGVDAIWLCPFFKSPMKDFGYDISDYRDVDPIFGSLADFHALVGRAHELDLRVIIDQVYSHTSDQHPWFRESRANRDNPRADWYVWADPKPDGSAAQQLAIGFRGTGVDMGCAARTILPAQFSGRAAGPQCAQSGGSRGASGHGPILARGGRRRLPAGCHQLRHA